MYRDESIGLVIAASGKGTRMGTEIPKQFLKIGGVPCLKKTADAFVRTGIFDEIAAAVPEGYTGMASELLDGIEVLAGGASRSDSVWKALEHIHSRYVLVHDGARPYITENLIYPVLDSVMDRGSTVPGIKPKDTVRTKDEVLDRDSLYLVQTPQGFLTDELKKAYALAASDGFEGTDDASYIEHAGGRIYIVPGDAGNIKITTKEDLPVETRIGHGFDVHRLVPDRKLILGGVEIPCEKGLLGHSDADVLLHAVMDAMLGACSLGDIGKLFPDSDPAYEGISSMELLKIVDERIKEHGYAVGNIDATVICQAPKIASHTGLMKKGMAEILDISPEDISVKGTTTEGLGAAGRGEGIACEAVCILHRQEI